MSGAEKGKKYSVYLHALKQMLQRPFKDDEERFQAIVDAPFFDKVQATHLDLGIVVLLLANTTTQTIDRVALSDTELAKGAIKMSAKPFKSIKIPLGHAENIIAAALSDNKPHETDDWRYLFVPALTPQAARYNQSGAGIECSIVYPLQVREGAALIFSFFQPPDNIGADHQNFISYYTALATHALT